MSYEKEFPEFLELEKWRRRDEKNSFYIDQGAMKQPYGQDNVLGGLDIYSYRLDPRTNNVIRTRTK